MKMMLEIIEIQKCLERCVRMFGNAVQYQDFLYNV